MPLRVYILHLCPFLFLLVKSLQQMIAELQVHIQVTVHRHGKNDIPNSVQLLLCEGNSAVCLFREQRLRRRDELLHTAVDLVEHLLVHVHNIHTALPNGIARIASEELIQACHHGKFTALPLAAFFLNECKNRIVCRFVHHIALHDFIFLYGG